MQQQLIGAQTYALRLQCQVPTTLVFVQPTQERVDLLMPLALDVRLTSPAWATSTLVDHLGRHPSVPPSPGWPRSMRSAT